MLLDLICNLIKDKIMQLKHIHFSIYAVLYILYSSVATGVGPIILYFSRVTGRDETYFAFIFLARGLGYLAGGQIIKFLAKKYRYYTLFVFLIILLGVSLVVSSFSFSFWNLFVSMFICAACSCMLNILCNLCVFELFAGPDQDYWLQMLNLYFGIGGLIGPFIVIIFEEYAFRAIGIFFFSLILPFLFLRSPETHQDVNKSEQKKKNLDLSPVAELCICLLFFFYVAEEVGYANWLPTYAKKAQVADKREASSIASIFWIVNTLARLALLYWSGPVQYRLRVLFRLLVASTIMVVFLQFLQLYLIVAYVGSISSALCLSAMYALFFSVVIDHGYGLSPSNTANFAISATMGEGLLVMPIGYAMRFFGIEALPIIILIMSTVMLLTFEYAIKHMQKDVREKKERMLIPVIEKEKEDTPGLDNF